MATGLLFTIDADASGLLKAFQVAEKSTEEFKDSVTSNMEKAAQIASSVWSTLGGAINEVATAFDTAMKGGAEKTEDVVASSVERSKKVTLDYLDSIEQTLSSKLGKAGPLLDNVWSGVKGTVASGFDVLVEKAAALFQHELVDTGKAAAAAASLAALARAFLMAGDEAENTGGKATQMLNGIKAYLDTVLNNALTLGEMREIEGALDAQTQKMERQIELIGKTAEARARLQAQWVVDDKIDETGHDLTDEQKGRVDAKLAELAIVAAKEDQVRAAQRYEQQMRTLLASLQEKAALERASTQELGRGAGEQAKARAEAQFNLVVQRQGIELTERDVELKKRALDLIDQEAAAKAAAHARFRMDTAVDSSLSTYRVQMDSIGASAGAQARLKFETEQYLSLIKAGIPVTRDWTEHIRQQGETLKFAADAVAGAQERARLDKDTSKDVANYRLQAAAIGQTAGEQARLKFETSQYQSLADRGIAVTRVWSDAIAEKGARIRNEADATAQATASHRMALAVYDDLSSYQLQIDAIGKTAGEQAKLRFEASQFSDLIKAGIPITDEWATKIGGAGDRIRQAADAATSAQQGFQLMQSMGTAVANNLESAFGRWMQGTSVKWSDMVDSMLADAARLLMHSALQSLLGTGSHGGGIIGTIWGGLFGGARAQGGDVLPGIAYQWQERGNEYFIPTVPGTVVRQDQMSSGGNSMHMSAPISIDARGADASIMARLDALVENLPAMMTRHMIEMLDRHPRFARAGL